MESHYRDCNYQCKCQFCIEKAKMCPIGLRPKLYKFRCDNKANYQSLREKHDRKWKNSMEIIQKIKASRHIHQVFVYTECDLILDWFQDISKITQKFGLTLKPSINPKLSLAHFIDITAQKFYPLFKHRSSVSHPTLLNHILNDNITALIHVTGTCQGHELGTFKIFSRKEGKETVNSDDIHGLLPSSFLSFLLKEKRMNFKLTSINNLFIFPNHGDENIFSAPAKKIMELIEIHKENKQASFLLKNLTNFLVGSFATEQKKFCSSVLLHRDDIPTLKLNRFQGSEHVTEDYCIGKFSNKGLNVNLSHINLNIIMMGRLQYLQSICLLTDTLCCSHIFGNTDGFSLKFPSPPTELQITSLPDLFNQFLRENLPMAKLQRYLQFLIDNVGLKICALHANEYMHHLRNSPKSAWNGQFVCCMKLPTKSHYLRLESCGEFGIFFKRNQAFVFNQTTNTIKTKASGIKHCTYLDFLSKCVTEEEKSVCHHINRLSKECRQSSTH